MRLYRGWRAAAFLTLREKVPLKFHVTAKWEQFDTRAPRHPACISNSKKRRSGATEIRYARLFFPHTGKHEGESEGRGGERKGSGFFARIMLRHYSAIYPR